ncbi:phytochrome sensor protein [Frankia sp. CNm7]|uniref:Phytochrome sensor protein n=1 Tax=Frankia nepalensis TaxID=1836974 RepID=A0A937RX19_9ACTN|nr:phytochrome sensor protein [Frankia nepalensis]MBL7497484.1 phytochrome sensor protein [Frankia nepalensis]MBL7509575.1 phytochrome sensor protein [Frankia nepalensis]MBL7517749.1 phytochrome sensor protein [Frankia nepalensis]MBL7633386.1 phytochrome sensor protein [Frankia nepalensis]
MTDDLGCLVQLARDAVAAGDDLPAGVARVLGREVRRAVVDSWTRSRSFGVDPEHNTPPVRLAGDGLAAARAAHPLAGVLPLIRGLLVDQIAADGMIVAVSDAGGTLLWVEGDRAVRGRAEDMGFTAGAAWDEAHAGTNAPGLALAIDGRARVAAAEHWVRTVRPWSCSASAVHDPADGRLLGALDVTGDSRAAEPAVLALISATVAAAERELLIRRLREPGRDRPQRPAGHRGPPRSHDSRTRGDDGQGGARGAGSRIRLEVASADAPALVRAGRRLAITPRHAELLLLLAEHPDGLTADELAAVIDERALDPVTVRAEMSRLRRAVGAGLVGSRPYRVVGPLETDVAELRRLLAAGDHAGVLDRWGGQLLPRSAAPGVAMLRDRLRAEVRAGLLRRRDPRLLLRWADSAAGEDDVGLWEACLRLLPPGPDRDRAAARLTLLHRELSAR